MTNRSILLVAAALLVPGMAEASAGHYASLAEAKAAAAEHKQLLLLDFFTET